MMTAGQSAEAPRRISVGLSPERVDWHLWNWERWQQFCTTPGKYSNRASGGIEGYTNFDIESEYEEGDRVAAAAVQAIIDGMLPALRLAVYIKHGITTVYRLRDVDGAYAEACGLLGVQLARRGLC